MVVAMAVLILVFAIPAWDDIVLDHPLWFILVFAIPAWVPIVPKRPLWPYLKQSTALTAALTLFSVSEILQLIFVGCVETGVLTLDYSLAFAGIGFTACIVALGTCLGSGIKNAVGIGLSSLLSLAMWLFLVMLH
jgi:hypothetical protein